MSETETRPEAGAEELVESELEAVVGAGTDDGDDDDSDQLPSWVPPTMYS